MDLTKVVVPSDTDVTNCNSSEFECDGPPLDDLEDPPPPPFQGNNEAMTVHEALRRGDETYDPKWTSRNWCFAAYEGSLPGLKWKPFIDLPDHPEGKANIKFCVWQYESCPQSGRTHIQGYIQFTKPCKRAQAQKWAALPRVNMLPAKGSAQENICYCTKSDSRLNGSPTDVGPFFFPSADAASAGKGSRTDLKQTARDILQGKTPEPVIMLKYPRGVEKLQRMRLPKRDWKTEVIIIYGPTDTGKTALAKKLGSQDGMNFYFLPASLDPKDQLKWFDDYNGEETVIIEEFVSSPENRSFMLRLMDRHEMKVAVKGSMVQFAPKRLIFTLNFDPKPWIAADPKNALDKRIETIIHVPKFGQWIFERARPVKDLPPEDLVWLDDCIKEYNHLKTLDPQCV
jgi:hypothetical protein